MTEISVEQRVARGKEALARGQYLSALADLEAAAAQRPAFADVQNLMGLCLSMVGRPEEALDAFARAVEVNPEYVEAHVNRAITLNDLGRTDEAAVSFQRAAEADEAKGGGGRFGSAAAARLANLHQDLGDLYAEAGGVDEAMAEYRKALVLRPQFLDIRNKLGRLLVEVGRHDEAVAELRGVVEARPSFAAARANLGLALYRAGRVEEAGAEWRRTLEQNPGNAQVSSYLGMLERQREGAAGRTQASVNDR